MPARAWRDKGRGNAAVRRAPWPLGLHFAALFALQALWAWLYVGSPYLRGAVIVPLLVRLAVWTAPVLVCLALERRRVLEYLKLTGGIGRGLAWGAGLGILILAANTAGHFFMSGAWRFRLDFAAPRWVNGVAMVGFSEEVAFRGFFLQRLAERMPFARANLLQALLFLLMHVPGWLLLGKLRFPGALQLAASIFLFALFAGWLLRRSGSLWACMLLHSFNNLASFATG